ncbi:MAG TPA: ribosome biogenesis GTPase YlqF [Polyangiaceae bacterium]
MIQWYPGHMTSARRVIAEVMPSIDVVIEVLDARMPRASANPIMTELRGTKPCVKVLSKSDLADPAVTKAWIDEIQIDPTAKAIATTTTKEADIRKRVPELCQKLAPHRVGVKTLRTMIVGVPNVGKSTLINTLMQRAVAKTGDEPAVTKSIQRVTMKNGMTISDHPGLLWPKIEDETVALKLAMGGAIPDTAIDYEHVALYGADIFLEHYPEQVRARYKLAELPPSAAELLKIIGTKRGGLKKGGVVDMHKAADALIHDFRSGVLGKISLERPGESAVYE